MLFNMDRKTFSGSGGRKLSQIILVLCFLQVLPLLDGCTLTSSLLMWLCG